MGRADMQTAESLLAMAARLAPGDHDTKQGLEWVRAACSAAQPARGAPASGEAAAAARRELARRRGLRLRRKVEGPALERAARAKAGSEAERVPSRPPPSLPPPPSRTNRTRLVSPFVLTGHVSSPPPPTSCAPQPNIPSRL